VFLLIDKIEVIRIVSTTSISLVALSMPIFGLLLSQILAKRGYPKEARPYKILCGALIILFLYATILGLLSFSLMAGFINEEVMVGPMSTLDLILILFLIMLITIPLLIIITSTIIIRR
jgi:hypothetical protein